MTSQEPLAAMREALYLALAGEGASVADAEPLAVLARMVESAREVAGTDVRAGALIEGLALVAGAGSVEAAALVAASRFESGAALSEAVWGTRCLGREAGPALALLEARSYVLAAVVPMPLAELSTDRAAVLEATSFAALWRDPGRGEWMLGAIGLWRRDYVAAYATRHEAYRMQMSAASEEIYASAAAMRAVEKLNGISRLGAPLGLEAVDELRELQDMWACDVTGTWLTEGLAESPVCSVCGYRLGDAAPVDKSKRLRRTIERALAGQQARLARHVVSRILARPPEGETQRLQRFIEVVQASDLSGLAVVLDDDLVALIEGLLAGEAVPSTVLSRLVEAYPEVTASNIEGAVEELRRLLKEELAKAESVRLQGSEEML